MATRAGRGKEPDVKFPPGHLGDEGAERYMWVFLEGNHIVLVIPGLRDLKLGANEARTVGEMLIKAANDMVKHHRSQGGSSDNHGSTEQPLTED